MGAQTEAVRSRGMPVGLVIGLAFSLSRFFALLRNDHIHANRKTEPVGSLKGQGASSAQDRPVSRLVSVVGPLSGPPAATEVCWNSPGPGDGPALIRAQRLPFTKQNMPAGVRSGESQHRLAGAGCRMRLRRKACTITGQKTSVLAAWVTQASYSTQPDPQTGALLRETSAPTPAHSAARPPVSGLSTTRASPAGCFGVRRKGNSAGRSTVWLHFSERRHQPH